MNIHHGDDRVTVHHGDCLDVMRGMPANSVDAIVTDPPYGLGFMGKAWDDLPPGLPWAQECLRILKPGGHLLAFGGTRTFHRLTCAIEDAGLEIRDSIAWLYGSGFPKSLDVSKAIDKAAGATREVVGIRTLGGRAAQSCAEKGGTYTAGAPSSAGLTKDVDVTAPATPAAQQWQGWGTALKPAFEPIVVARKPPTGTVAANIQAHGTGALNIDATRVAHADDIAGKYPNGPGGARRHDVGLPPGGRTEAVVQHSAGRWPTNVLLDGDMADELDAQTGTLTSGKMAARTKRSNLDGWAGPMPAETATETYGDSGGASRFFPVFKYQAKAPTRERPKVAGVAHPTCKPLELMRWLVRLTVGGRPDAIVLDPFAGSGTTLEACLLEGVRSVGIERETDYLPLIMHRITRAYAAKAPADDDEDVS